VDKLSATIAAASAGPLLRRVGVEAGDLRFQDAGGLVVQTGRLRIVIRALVGRSALACNAIDRALINISNVVSFAKERIVLQPASARLPSVCHTTGRQHSGTGINGSHMHSSYTQQQQHQLQVVAENDCSITAKGSVYRPVLPMLAMLAPPYGVAGPSELYVGPVARKQAHECCSISSCSARGEAARSFRHCEVCSFDITRARRVNDVHRISDKLLASDKLRQSAT